MKSSFKFDVCSGLVQIKYMSFKFDVCSGLVSKNALKTYIHILLRTFNLDPSFTSLQKGRPKHRSNFRMCVRIFYQSLSSLIAFPLAILVLLIFAYLTIVYLCDDLIKRRLIELSLGSLTQGFP